jgi:hypothetical protein
MKIKDVPYKTNIEMLFKHIFKESIFRRLCFIDEKTNEMCLDGLKFRLEPLQVPFIYHTKLLKIINIMIE